MNRVPIERLQTLDETIKEAQRQFSEVEKDPSLGVNLERKIAVRAALATAHGHVSYIRHVAELRLRKAAAAGR